MNQFGVTRSETIFVHSVLSQCIHLYNDIVSHVILQLCVIDFINTLWRSPVLHTTKPIYGSGAETGNNAD